MLLSTSTHHVHTHSAKWGITVAFFMQVLSKSVRKALQLTEGPEAQKTARFVLMLDKFFDALNVGDLKSVKHHRKPFQAPNVLMVISGWMYM